jgi:hypothetical protein
MFSWYKKAKKCYVYLSDVFVPEEVTKPELFQEAWEEKILQSRWFTRGWTFQELLAPSYLEFYSKNGKRLGSRESLRYKIHKITKIPFNALGGWSSLARFSIEERTSWAAKRTTTLREDEAYCLIGIGETSMEIIYGEGKYSALKRLRKNTEK